MCSIEVELLFGFVEMSSRDLGFDFRVQGVGFGVQGSGIRVQGSGSGCTGQGSGHGAQGSGIDARGAGRGARGLLATYSRAFRIECVTGVWRWPTPRAIVATSHD